MFRQLVKLTFKRRLAVVSNSLETFSFSTSQTYLLRNPVSCCSVFLANTSSWVRIRKQDQHVNYRYFHQGVSLCHNSSIIEQEQDGVTQRNSKSDIKLHSTQDSEKTFARLTETYPQLEEYNKTELLPYLEFMTIYAITVDLASEILLKYPAIIKSYKEKIPSTLGALRGMGLSEIQRKNLLHKHPGIINFPKNYLLKRMGFLKTYLSSTESIQVANVSIGSILDNESILKKKLEYLIKSVSHETKNITNCNVLDFPLNRMKMRHEFLVRTGLFKPIPYQRMIKVLEKERTSKTRRAKYFLPFEIVCTGDAQFLKLCTKSCLSVNELAAFEELYTKELQNQEESDDENDVDDSEYSDNEDDSKEKDITSIGNKAEGDQYYF